MKKKQLPISLPHDLREALERESAKFGHSLACEVRRRLWSSFASDDIHPESLAREKLRYERAHEEDAKGHATPSGSSALWSSL